MNYRTQKNNVVGWRITTLRRGSHTSMCGSSAVGVRFLSCAHRTLRIRTDTSVHIRALLGAMNCAPTHSHIAPSSGIVGANLCVRPSTSFRADTRVRPYVFACRCLILSLQARWMQAVLSFRAEGESQQSGDPYGESRPPRSFIPRPRGIQDDIMLSFAFSLQLSLYHTYSSVSICLILWVAPPASAAGWSLMSVFSEIMDIERESVVSAKFLVRSSKCESKWS